MQDGTQNPFPQPSAGDYDSRPPVAQAWYAVRLCLGFLTRIPVFTVEYSGARSLASASWAFPVVGMIVALTGTIVLWLADAFSLGAQVSALMALACMTAVTGALHEDGLADTADGFGLSGDAEKRIAAMRDPRIGVFGMIALIIVFSARWLTLGDLIAVSFWGGVETLIAAAAISRGMLPAIMHAVPNARTEGLSFAAGRPDAGPAGLAIAISALISLFVFGFGGTILIALIVGITAIAIVATARRLIGGQTGDVLGAVQQLTEVAILVTAAGLAA